MSTPTPPPPPPPPLQKPAETTEKASPKEKLKKRSEEGLKTFYTEQGGICAEKKAAEKPAEGAFDTLDECKVFLREKTALTLLQEWLLGSLSQLRKPRQTIADFDRLWHTKMGPNDPLPNGKFGSVFVAFIPSIMSLRSLRTYDALRTFMEEQTAKFKQRVQRWEDEGKVNDFEVVANQKDFSNDMPVLERQKNAIDEAYTQFKNAEETLVNEEGRWIAALNGLSSNIRVAAYDIVKESGERDTKTIVDAIMQAADLKEFMGFTKGGAPSEPQAGSGVSAAELQRIINEIKAQFRSFAPSVSQAAPTISVEYVERLEKSMKALQAELAQIRPDTADMLKRISAEMIITLSKLSVPQQSAKEELRSIIAEETTKAISKMSACMVSGMAVSPTGSCVRPLGSCGTYQCTFILSDGKRCKNIVGPSGDKSRYLCHVHA